jgi:hypothetical protein
MQNIPPFLFPGIAMKVILVGVGLTGLAAWFIRLSAFIRCRRHYLREVAIAAANLIEVTGRGVG